MVEVFNAIDSVTFCPLESLAVCGEKESLKYVSQTEVGSGSSDIIMLASILIQQYLQ